MNQAVLKAGYFADLRRNGRDLHEVRTRADDAQDFCHGSHGSGRNGHSIKWQLATRVWFKAERHRAREMMSV
jgi:hypothetical protein